MSTRRKPNDVARPVARSALLLSPNQRSAPEETALHANPKIITLHRSNAPFTRQRPPLIAGTSRTFPPLLTGSPSSWPHTRARSAPASCTLWHSPILPTAVERPLTSRGARGRSLRSTSSQPASLAQMGLPLHHRHSSHDPKWRASTATLGAKRLPHSTCASGRLT